MKKYLVLFLTAFVLNLVWENLHSVLYVSYKGGEITEGILLHATTVDAFIILAVFLATAKLPNRFRFPLSAITFLIIAIITEWWALGTGRWVYAETMPIIPFIGTGLSPTIQLASTGIASFLFVEKIFNTKETDPKEPR